MPVLLPKQAMKRKQSQKTQGFCVADFVTLSDERKSRSKIFPLFIWIKEPCVRKFEGLERLKNRGISQTKNYLPNYGLGVIRTSDESSCIYTEKISDNKKTSKTSESAMTTLKS